MSILQRTLKKQKTYSSKWEWSILGLLLVGTFLLRVLGQLDRVFVGSNVWYRGVDSWYHMRLVDATTKNFPGVIDFDRYTIWPSGHEVGYMPLMQWIIGSLGQIWSPEIIAAYLPPILGTLTLIPVYLIGRELFSGKVGLLGCFLVAVIPGEFLHRTLLGFTDHHALEVFLMSLTLFLTIRAYKGLKWKWLILAGVSLGLYNLAWAGTSLFLLILGIWAWLEFLRRYKKGEDITAICKLVSVPVSIGLLLSFPWLWEEALVINIGVLVIPIGLWLLTRYIKDKEYVLFGLTILVPVALAILGVFYSWKDLLTTFFWAGSTTIEEAGWLEPGIMFATYGISLLVALGGLWVCRRDKYTSLFIVWAVILIIMSIGQRKWGYYTALPVGLLASYFAFHSANWFKPAVRPAIILVMIFFLLMPMITNTLRLAQLPNNITADWYVALTWMDRNTPDPFPEGSYTELEVSKKAEYGVLSWWDYGHWIIRIAHRVPTDSPTITTNLDSKFFTSETEEEANSISTGIRYVIVDKSLLESKWKAIAKRGDYEGDIKDTMLWKLWHGEAETWSKEYERGEVKVYGRKG